MQPIVSDALANTLKGTVNGEAIDGQGENDTLLGGAGDDRLDGGIGDDLLQSGNGQDRLVLDAGSDQLDGGAGLDWVVVTGTVNAAINLGATAAQDTGPGLDTLVGIENALGAVGNDRLTGSAGQRPCRAEPESTRWTAAWVSTGWRVVRATILLSFPRRPTRLSNSPTGTPTPSSPWPRCSRPTSRTCV